MVDIESFQGLEVNWSSSEEMDATENDSVQSVITSPPYWDLKDYGHEQQIGTSDESYDEYHERMQTVWEQCYNVLKESGTMWVVVDTVMDRGDLQLLPYHIAQRAEEIGFTLQDIITWHKPTAIAGMSNRNVVNKKEYILYLSKSDEPKFSTDEISYDKADPACSDEHRLGNLWRFPVKRGSVGKSVLHKAPYPEALADRLVKISTDRGDTVIDPFLGSGTTAYSALNSGRKCIGYEINDEFDDVIAERLAPLNQQSLTEF